MHKIRPEGDHQTLTFGIMQLFELMQPLVATGPSKSSKRGVFPGSLNKKWEFEGCA